MQTDRYPDTCTKTFRQIIQLEMPFLARWSCLILQKSMYPHWCTDHQLRPGRLAGLLALCHSLWLSPAYCLCFACVTFKAIPRSWLHTVQFRDNNTMAPSTKKALEQCSRILSIIQLLRDNNVRPAKVIFSNSTSSYLVSQGANHYLKQLNVPYHVYLA